MIESTRSERVPYLLLLARPSAAARAEAARSVRDAGHPVLAQYGSVALEALATPNEAAALNELGLFAAVLSGAMKTEHLDRLTDEQRPVVELWNTRFSRGYLRGEKKAEALRGRPWDDPELTPPGADSDVDPEDFLEFVRDTNSGRASRSPRSRRGAGVAVPDGEEFVEFDAASPSGTRTRRARITSHGWRRGSDRSTGTTSST